MAEVWWIEDYCGLDNERWMKQLCLFSETYYRYQQTDIIWKKNYLELSMVKVVNLRINFKDFFS